MDFPTLVLERPHHGILERRFRCATGRREGLGDGARAVLGKFQEVLEVDNAFGAGASEVNLLGTKRREDQKLAARICGDSTERC
jgi:hypothetical protein